MPWFSSWFLAKQTTFDEIKIYYILYVRQMDKYRGFELLFYNIDGHLQITCIKLSNKYMWIVTPSLRDVKFEWFHHFLADFLPSTSIFHQYVIQTYSYQLDTKLYDNLQLHWWREFDTDKNMYKEATR